MAFTPENAAIMQAKAVIQRKLNQELHENEPEPVPEPPAITAIIAPQIAQDSYLSQRLVRTRDYIEKVEIQMNECIDEPQAVDRYASAIAKLSEIERQLAGRPMPGSLKPTQPKPRKAQLTIDPSTLPKAGTEPDQG